MPFPVLSNDGWKKLSSSCVIHWAGGGSNGHPQLHRPDTGAGEEAQAPSWVWDQQCDSPAESTDTGWGRGVCRKCRGGSFAAHLKGLVLPGLGYRCGASLLLVPSGPWGLRSLTAALVPLEEKAISQHSQSPAASVPQGRAPAPNWTGSSWRPPTGGPLRRQPGWGHGVVLLSGAFGPLPPWVSYLVTRGQCNSCPLLSYRGPVSAWAHKNWKVPGSKTCPNAIFG